MPKPNLEVLLILSAWSDFIREGSGFCVQCGVVEPDEDGTCCICGATCTGRALTEHAGNVQDALRYAQEVVEEERERIARILTTGDFFVRKFIPSSTEAVSLTAESVLREISALLISQAQGLTPSASTSTEQK